tara:strand:- start:402 stop:947 length:546 start_codon:yes stop_codon:yes gene_type:complete
MTSTNNELVTYTVYETTHDNILLSSQFFNRDDVNDYIDRFTSRRSTVHVYRTSCVDVLYPFLDTSREPTPPIEITNPPEAEASLPPTPTRRSTRKTRSQKPTVAFDDYVVLENEDETMPFSGFTIRPYGKGFVLIAPENHSIYGAKYINENRGFWNNNANGWFFRKIFLKSFLDQGAIREI